MTARTRWLGLALFLSLAVVAIAMQAPAPTAEAGTCYGTLFEYYQTSACINQVGSKVVCPGYPDQIDMGPDGTYTHTPYYTTQTVVCPCPSGGGGGGGGGDTGETGEW